MTHFRLEPIVKLREQARDERRRELAQAFEAERILRGQIAEMQAEVAATHDRTRRLAAEGSVNVQGLVDSRRYELLVKSQIAGLETRLAAVLEELERRRQTLMEADRDVKALEKLRERQAAEHEQTEARREARRIDEAALRGYTLRREAAR